MIICLNQIIKSKSMQIQSALNSRQHCICSSTMIDIQELFTWALSFLIHVLQRPKKSLSSMSVALISSPSPSPSSPSGPQWLRRKGTTTTTTIFSSDAHQSPSHDNSNSRRLPVIICDQDSRVSSNTEGFVPVPVPVLRRLPFLHEKEEGESKRSNVKSRKRPAMLVLPEFVPGPEFADHRKSKGMLNNNEMDAVEGENFCVVSKKGRREVMEDGYGVTQDISGDPKQAFFVVVDGHGGKAATEYVVKNLGNNVVKQMELHPGKEKASASASREDDSNLEAAALRGGYSVTDRNFLLQGVNGGACAASVLLKDGEVNVANAGDCRVVLCRNGVASSLTTDHRLSTREDERIRIDNSGGYVDSRNGVWRVNGSLAVSRAFGDIHLKQWVISEPEMNSFSLTPDCQFLILASDGLWDKVNEQEAVDVVLSRGGGGVESCRKLVELSSSRGNMDDITVMLVHHLQTFIPNNNSNIPTANF